MMSITFQIQSLNNKIFSSHPKFSSIRRSISTKEPKLRNPIFESSRKTLFIVSSKSSSEWLNKLPEKNSPLYSHSLPCVEAWLYGLGFYQSRSDRALWLIQKPDWHAQLSLDVTHIYIRYLKSGPGNLEKDVERRFGYAVSREDIENAVLGGP